MSKLRVAVIGAGIAQKHLEGFCANPDLYDITVLCSLDEEPGKEAAAELDVCEFTTDTDPLFSRNDVDVIDVCKPRHQPAVDAPVRATRSSG